MNKKLKALLEERGGIISAKEAAACGITRTMLSSYASQGMLERACQGVYMLPDTIPDEAYILSLRYPGAIFSHASALYMNQLAERAPVEESVSFETGKLPTKEVRSSFRCFSVTAALHHLGATMRQTAFGHTVPCYDAERTICDLLRSRTRGDEETLIAALKNYASSGRVQAARLADYAKRFGVLRTLTPYMEVLL